ncbi:MAG: hypothetical protein ABI168_08975 [Ginsengibacter sp.]
MKQKTLIGVLFLLSSTINSLAQSILKPGDPLIKTDWLQSSHDFYRNVITDTTGKLKYDFMMENICTVDTARGLISFARFRQVPVGNFSTDTSITDLNFKPVRMHEVHEQKQKAVEMVFDAQKVIVKKISNGKSIVQSYPMEPGYFEDNMIEYIFGCLQLERGKTYILNNFNTATHGNDPFMLKYEFEDTLVPAADLKIICSVLQFTHGATSGYIWIDKNSHKILKTLGRSKGYNYILTRQ